MKKIGILSALMLIVMVSTAQTGVLNHYQRKLKIDEPIVTCENYQSKVFGIVYSDSIYSEAEIKVKKLYVSDVGKVKFLASMKDGKYTKTIYLSKKKDRLVHLIKHLNQKIKKQSLQIEAFEEVDITRFGKFYQLNLKCN